MSQGQPGGCNSLLPWPPRKTSPLQPTLDAFAFGEPDAPLVLLLHGFAESMHCWRAQVAALAAAGLSRGDAKPAWNSDRRASGHFCSDPA
jgi:pimeloyl-ACP methyl ester carboxylesterase